MFTTTVQQIIDSARIRHWAFADVALGDGAVLLYLSQRLRTHLAIHGATIEGLVGTTMTYQIATVNGLLIAEVNGIPQYTTTYQDGWPIHVDPITGIPYYDTSEPMIATDPFGIHGGTPGFPLPSDMVRLTSVVLTLSLPPALQIPCDVRQEGNRLQMQPGRNPIAFVSGNRLVPLLAYASPNANSGDRWFNVQSLIMGYVALPTLQSLTDVLNLPSVLAEALIADAAELLASHSAKLAPAEKLAFAQKAANTGTLMAAAGLDLLDEPEEETVKYLG